MNDEVKGWLALRFARGSKGSRNHKGCPYWINPIENHSSLSSSVVLALAESCCTASPR